MDWSKGLLESFELTTFFLVPGEPIEGVEWYDKDGQLTYDEVKVIDKKTISIPQNRKINNQSDFKYIYDREFAKSKLADTQDNHTLFIKELRKHIQTLITKHSANREYATTDFELLSGAESFLNYLDPYMIANPNQVADLARNIQSKTKDKLPYNIENYRFFSFDGAIKIHYQYYPEDDLETYKRFVFSRENIQLAIHFEKMFLAADESGAVKLLQNQYKRAEAMGTPNDIWLNNVELIIDHHQLLKRPAYAKADSVKMWFIEKRRELTLLAAAAKEEEIPFIGELFHKDLSISKVVYDAYYGLVRQPQTREEISKHYVGSLNRHNQPYQVSYFGAYMNMDTLEIERYKMTEKLDPYDKVTESDIEKALKDYAKGFKEGYHTFEKEVLDKNPFQDKEHKAQIIFNFVYGGIKSASSLPTSYGNRGGYFAEWENTGIGEGQKYRAWYLILQNHQLFTPLFEKYKVDLGRKLGHQKPELSIKQIALIYVFENKSITRANGNEIATEYGHQSGEKLFQQFTFYSNSQNRKRIEITKITHKNKIRLFESISDKLSDINKAKLQTEIVALNNALLTAEF